MFCKKYDTFTGELDEQERLRLCQLSRSSREQHLPWLIHQHPNTNNIHAQKLQRAIKGFGLSRRVDFVFLRSQTRSQLDRIPRISSPFDTSLTYTAPGSEHKMCYRILKHKCHHLEKKRIPCRHQATGILSCLLGCWNTRKPCKEAVDVLRVNHACKSCKAQPVKYLPLTNMEVPRNSRGDEQARENVDETQTRWPFLSDDEDDEAVASITDEDGEPAPVEAWLHPRSHPHNRDLEPIRQAIAKAKAERDAAKRARKPVTPWPGHGPGSLHRPVQGVMTCQGHVTMSEPAVSLRKPPPVKTRGSASRRLDDQELVTTVKRPLSRRGPLRPMEKGLATRPRAKAQSWPAMHPSRSQGRQRRAIQHHSTRRVPANHRVRRQSNKPDSDQFVRLDLANTVRPIEAVERPDLLSGRTQAHVVRLSQQPYSRDSFLVRAVTVSF